MLQKVLGPVNMDNNRGINCILKCTPTIERRNTKFNTGDTLYSSDN